MNRLDSERRHFDNLVEETGETWWGSKTPAGQERLRIRGLMAARTVETIGPDPIVVELGCGTGAFSKFVLEALPDLCLHAFDISPKAVSTAAQRLSEFRRAQFREGDALSLPLGDESVDAVIGVSVLHHLPLSPCLAEIVRVLRPGGIIWFSEPNMLNPQILLEKNIRFIGALSQSSPDETAFFRWSLRRNILAAGFSHAIVRPFDFLHPLTPKSLISSAKVLGSILDHIPGAREFSGSLLITGRK